MLADPLVTTRSRRRTSAAILVGAGLAIVFMFGAFAWDFYEVATDGTFRRRLPTRPGMTESEIVAILGKPAEVVRREDLPAKSVAKPGYSFGAYSGSCGDLPSWERRGEASIGPAPQLPAPTGKLLWYYGRSVLVAGYYLDGHGRLTCLVLGLT